MFNLLTKTENELQLHEGFFEKLLEEDDWSFVIKIHAIIESAVSQKLANTLDKRLLSIFQRLDLGDRRIGKVVFARELGLLSKADCSFIQNLSELRNLLVHNIRNTNFNFRTHIDSLDKEKRKKFLSWLVAFSYKESRAQWIQNAFDNPKIPIWLNTISLIWHASLVTLKAELDREMQSVAYRLLQIKEPEIS